MLGKTVRGRQREQREMNKWKFLEVRDLVPGPLAWHLMPHVRLRRATVNIW